MFTIGTDETVARLITSGIASIVSTTPTLLSLYDTDYISVVIVDYISTVSAIWADSSIILASPIAFSISLKIASASAELMSTFTSTSSVSSYFSSFSTIASVTCTSYCFIF